MRWARPSCRQTDLLDLEEELLRQLEGTSIACLHAWRNARPRTRVSQTEGLSRIWPRQNFGPALVGTPPEGTAAIPGSVRSTPPTASRSQQLRGQGDHQPAMWAGPAAALPGSRFFGAVPKLREMEGFGGR